MSFIDFPLFLLPLARGTSPAGDAVFGAVLGTSLRLVASSERRATDLLGDALRKEMAASPWLGEDAMTDARLDLRRVAIHLAYEDQRSSYPLPRPLLLEVAAVWGRVDDGNHWQCHLPLLERTFHYYSAEQRTAMVEHFSRERLEGLPPEQAHRFVMRHPPALERIRVRRDDAKSSAAPRPPDTSALLRQCAEAVPAPRARNRSKLLPQAAWERGALVERLAGSVRARSNVLLVGPDGVGKSTVWNDVVRRLHRLTRRSEKPLRFFRTSAQRLVANARYLGEWQEQVEALCDELDQLRGVLWLVDIVNLVETGGHGPQDSVAAYLLPRLRAGRLTLLGEVTPAELEAIRRRLPGLLDAFSLVEVAPFERAEMQRILAKLGAYTKRTLGLPLDETALARVDALTRRHLPQHANPGKSVDLLEAAIRDARAGTRSTLSGTDVEATFSRRTGLPPGLIDDRETIDLTAVRAYFRRRVMGQEAALDALVNVVATYKAGLNDPRRPLATLLLCGPTGVGKSAAAHALADYFFAAHGAQDLLYRVDMSELQHPAQVTRLIGDGTREPGPLVRHLRLRPFCVLLLDEIEKAHPSFFDLLLSALDEGRLTDAQGRVTDLTNTVIVITSNLGTRRSEPTGFVTSPTDDSSDAVRAFFRPEFFNRIDATVSFQPLGADVVRDIARRELEAIAQREGLALHGSTLEFDEAVVVHVAKVGFSPRFGARPLQRTIEAEVVAAISHALNNLNTLNTEHGAARARLRLAMDGERVTVSVET